MSLDDGNTDEYIVTALQIFQYCGVDAGSTLRVDALMEKFAPFVKTNRAEHSFLKSLLDPEHINPEITVSMLANSLNKYSESQKVKVDLDESFNLKSGQAPQDSDSGISTDGFSGCLLLEELQCELREKAHLAQQLRTQLDYTDRHHEEALATVTAERDSLRAHLNMLREENVTLTHVRRDYEDVCERLCCTERALDESRKELEGARRRAKVLTEQVNFLENEKLSLQELLSKSKDECHRINDMYVSRQSSLLEENETLRNEHADLSSRMQDQQEYMQQIMKEKLLLEMELKDVLNKSNQQHTHMDRSIDVSFTEDQMLTELDSLKADSRFPQEGRLLDEESFVKALKEDHGRLTNMSLYDEIRLSFCNMSRHNMTGLNSTQPIERSQIVDDVTVATQTDDELHSDAVNVAIQTDDQLHSNINEDEFHNINSNMNTVNVAMQTDEDFNYNSHKDHFYHFNCNTHAVDVAMQTDDELCSNNHKDEFCHFICNKNIVNVEMQTDEVFECNGHKDVLCNFNRTLNVSTPTNDYKYFRIRNSSIDNRKQTRSLSFPIVKALKHELSQLDDRQNNICIEPSDKSTDTSVNVFDVFKDVEVKNFGVQTDLNDIQNNNIECIECSKCLECEKLKKYVTSLENQVNDSNSAVIETRDKLVQCEGNLDLLTRLLDEGNERNNHLKTVTDCLKGKLDILESVCSNQRDKIKSLYCDTSSAELQTKCGKFISEIL